MKCFRHTDLYYRMECNVVKKWAKKFVGMVKMTIMVFGIYHTGVDERLFGKALFLTINLSFQKDMLNMMALLRCWSSACYLSGCLLTITAPCVTETFSLLFTTKQSFLTGLSSCFRLRHASYSAVTVFFHSSRRLSIKVSYSDAVFACGTDE